MNDLRRIISVTVFLLSVLTGRAETLGDLFSYENDTFAGVNLNYRKTQSGQDTATGKIVVIYLHGGSGQGDDNESQMKTQAVSDIYNYLKDNIRDFVFLVPQVPDGQQWRGTAIPVLKALADKYSANGKSEVYILGGSMGGYGVWNMLTAYPEYFSGAMPVAGNTPVEFGKFTSVAILSVVGTDDPRRRIDEMETFFRRLAENGGTARLDIEQGWSHRKTCEECYTQERLAWLFSHARNLK